MRDAGALSHAPGRRASALPVPTLLLLSFLSLGAPFALALAPAAARAATFTGLGFLTDGTGSVAFGLSADGSTVVGSSSTPAGTEAFRWTSGGGMQPLGTLGGAVPFSQAFGVSADGSAIVGESNSIDGREAFVWTAGGGMVGLDDLAGGAFFSQARGISNDGGVVVGVGTSGSGNEAFRWTSGGGLVGLGDLAGGQFASDAYAASGDGSVVVGFGTPGTLPSDASHDAFRWTQTDGPLAISDPLVLAPDNEAYGVSPDGAFVVGRRSDAVTDPQAFLWTAALGMSVLGDLPGGAVASAAFDVSADGTRVVGAGDSGGDENAFLWVDGVGLRALRDVIAGDYGLDLTGWELFAATAISDDGNAIAGWGRHDGVNQAFLFVVPEPATAPLLAVALAALAGRRRRRHCAGPRRHRGASRAATALGAAALLALVACGPTDLEHYRGAVHEHSGYSDGVPGSVPADYFAAADAAGLDFLGSGEHSDSEDVPVVFSEDCLAVPDIAGCAIADPDSPINSFRKWEATGEQAAAATTPDFTAFRGFEWTSDRFGHINVYFSRQAVNAKIDGGYATMEAFWAWFTRRPNEGGGGDGLATFNHPDDKKLSDLDPGRNWNDFAYVPAADDRVVGIEVFNGGSRDDYADWYVRALDKGWHVGAVGAEDSHGPTWATPDLAKTVLIARDRSPGALYEAMYARRMYAQLDADVRIDMFAGGQPMGSQLARKVGNNAPILANVAIDGGAGTVTQLDLISNGGVVVASAAGPLLLYDAVVTADERWYFLRVTAPVDGTDQVVAYSSPVWIREAAYPPRGHWVAGDLHVHTTYSHDSYGGPDDDNTGPDEGYTLGHTVDRQFIIGAVRGLDYLAITDHNDVRSQSDPGFATQNLVGLPSYENSLQGHAQMHGATRIYDNGDSSIARVRALADELRADGGVFQVNHPAGESVDFPDDADWKYFRDGYEGDVVPDAVEILNISSLWQPPAPSSNSIDDAIRYWEGFLDRGHRVAATGGSDNHWVSTTAAQGAGQPATWVFVTERSVRGVLEGLRAGHTFISYQPPAHEGPRVFLEADRDRDGVFESKVGNRVPAGARFRVSVEGGSGMLLDLVYDGSRRLGLPMPVAGAPFVYEFDLPAWATWVRAELYTADLDAERTAVCDGLVGDQSTLCRNRLAITGLTSAIYQHP